jgi:hypothetical protein
VTFNPKWIEGKTVASCRTNPEDDGKGGTFHRPAITFTDGSSIRFVTEETEVGDYGTEIVYHRPPKKAGGVSFRAAR